METDRPVGQNHGQAPTYGSDRDHDFPPTPIVFRRDRRLEKQIVAVLDEMSSMYKVAGDGVRADSFQRLASVLRFLDRRSVCKLYVVK